MQTTEEDATAAVEGESGKFYSHDSQKEEPTLKKLGSENEMKKISTEYVSNMLEKFEVD